MRPHATAGPAGRSLSTKHFSIASSTLIGAGTSGSG